MGFTIPNADAVAYPAMARLFNSDIVIIEQGGEGYAVQQGCNVVPGTTTGTVKVNAGTSFYGSTFGDVTLQDNIACAANAYATNPKWQLIEIDSSGTVQTNVGTAAVNPEPPTPTAGRAVVAALYIPANATTVDAASLSTVNGNIKIIDKRLMKQTVETRGYTTAGTYTWTKPPGARVVKVYAMGGGGGGGSGRCGATNAKRCGGGGGGAGNLIAYERLGTLVGSTVTVTVGAGGGGATAVGTAAADGGTGTGGGTSTFGVNDNQAVGGSGGGGGTNTTVGAGGAGGAIYGMTDGRGCAGGNGGDGTAAATNNSATLGTNALGGGGGGGGGGLPTGNGEQVGSAGGWGNVMNSLAGVGGGTAGAVHGTGGNGVDPGSTAWVPGNGGGGGGSSNSNSVNGGTGGNGTRGAGGGGGGAGTSGGTAHSGAGGAGADGFVIVITYCQ